MSSKYGLCSIDNLSIGKAKKRRRPYSPDERNDLRKRAAEFVRRADVNALKYQYADESVRAAANKTSLLLQNDLEKVGRIGEMVTLQPRKIDRFNEWLYTQFGQKYAYLLGGISTPGKVGEWLQDTRRVAAGLIDDLVLWHGGQAVSKMRKNFTKILKAKGVRLSYEELNELIWETIEIGHIPKVQSALHVGPVGMAELRKLYQEWTERLDELGLDGEDINLLRDLAAQIPAKMDEVRALGIELGLDIGKVDGIGYVPRVLTPDAQMWLKDLNVNDAAKGFLDEFQKESNPLRYEHAFNKSRQTFKFIPEDEALASYSLGVEVDELRAMMKDGTLQDYIHKKFTGAAGEEALEDILDRGYLSKLPMTSKEVFNYMLSQYGDLPFKGMSELFETDVDRVYDFYRRGLQRAAGESQMIKGIVSDGLTHGWAVTQGTWKSSPEFKDFVPIEYDDIKKFFPAYEGVEEAVYVHPTVRNVWRSIMDLSTDPAKLNTYAQLARTLGTIFVQSMLITPQYVARILYSTVILHQAGGGNILRLPEHLRDTMRLFSKGIEALDDGNKVYKWGDEILSKREWTRRFLLRRGRSIAPQAVVLDAGGKFNANLFMHPGRGLNYLRHYMAAHGGATNIEAWGQTGLYALQQFQRGQSELFGRFASAASFGEFVGKYGLALSLADTSPGNKVGQFLSGSKPWMKQFNTPEELLRHVDDYYFPFDDVGKVTSFVGRYVMPFASYWMRNPPAMMRHAMRNPEQFINYWRIRSFINEPAGEDESVVEGAFAPWQLDAGPLVVKRDKDHIYSLLTNSYDPISDAFTPNIAKGVLGAAGFFTGTAEEQRQQLANRYKESNTFFAGLFKDAIPLVRDAASLLFNVDPVTGDEVTRNDFLRKRQSSLGISVPGWGKLMMEMYPPLDWINRKNPFDIFGVPEITDPRNPMVPLVKGKPSIFGAERTDLSSSQMNKYLPAAQSLWFQMLNEAGTGIQIIEKARKMQKNYDQTQGMAADIKKQISSASKEIQLCMGGPDSPGCQIGTQEELDRQIKNIEQARLWYEQLNIDMMRIGSYLNNNKIPTKDAWEEMRKRNVKSLPPIGEDAARVRLSKFLTEMAELNKNTFEPARQRYLKLKERIGG